MSRSSDQLNLEVLPSDFGLPSVDAECLQYLAACKFCLANVNVSRSTRTWTTPNGRFPVFSTTKPDGRVVHHDNFNSFVAYLKSRGDDMVLDAHLSDTQKAEILTYGHFVRNRLLPAYLYSIWVDEHNYATVTNHWFARHVTFPFNQWHVTGRRNEATTLLNNMYPGANISMANIEYAVVRQGIACLNMLSAKLGDQKYFTGDKPSSLDALIFGYVAPLLKLPLPSDRLQQHLKACPNLTRFVETIISIYLPLSDEEITQQRRMLTDWEMRRTKRQEVIRKTKQHEQRSKSRDQEKEANAEEFHLTDKIIFGVFAATVSILAALHFGLIKVELQSANNDDYEESAGPRPKLPDGMDFGSPAEPASATAE